MLQEVIDLQTSAVKKLAHCVSLKDDIVFKSPTGSGKTYMMADLMNRVIEDNKNVIFLVSSLSKGDLAQQNYEKFLEYSDKGTFSSIKPYLISSETSGENRLHIPTDYNVYVLPRDLYKDKSKLKQGALHDFLYAVTNQKMGLGKDIYVIKDECHIATANLDALAKDFFKKVLNFSATPSLKNGQTPDVEITEIDAINAKLIKKVEYHEEEESLDVIFDKYESIKADYNRLLGINPCLIVQISNKDKADEEIKKLRIELDKRPDLKWMLIMENDKDCDTNDVFKTKKLPVSKWKEYAKKDTGTIDVIIFKMVITEGWDIPRACMLYQIRDSKSKQLDEQVVGRVRRNPRLLTYEKLSQEAKDLIGTAYVWGLKPKDSKQVREVKLVGSATRNEVQSEIKIKTTRIKRPLESTTFDIHTFLDGKPKKTVPTSIFELYKKQGKTTNEVKEMCDEYVDDFQSWFKFMENIDAVANESKNIVCDYNANMELAKDENGNEIEVSFPLISYYTDNANYKSIGNWLWQRTDGKDEFSFDSIAEKEWAEILLSLISEDAPTGDGRLARNVSIKEIVDNEEVFVKKYMIGKNYLSGSEIRFEYYLNGIRSSYPDFIMKDWKDRIHIFETKSLNQATDSNIDGEEYETKVNALKDAYKYASKLTGYYFYIPIQKEDKWIIYQYTSGEEKMLSKSAFLKFMKI